MRKQGLTYLLILFATLCFGQTWQWARSGNGSGGDECYAVGTDKSGNAYITGGFNSTSITFGAITMTCNVNDFPVFLTKYDPNGNVLWAKSSSNTGEYGNGRTVCTDNSGNVFVAGNFWSSTLTFGTYTLVNAGFPNDDIFLVKYNSAGNVLWAKRAGGVNGDFAYSVSADASGNIFISGFFASPTIAFGTSTLSNSGVNNSIFIAKYDSNGNPIWAKTATGTISDNAYGVKTDQLGNAFLTGDFTSPTITFGSYTLTNSNAGAESLFLSKYDTNGNVLWAVGSNGTSHIGYSVGSDALGNAYVAGAYTGTANFGTYTLTSVGDYDIFLTKYNPSGNVLWAKSAGGVFSDQARSLGIGGGAIFVTGPFSSSTLTLGALTIFTPSNSIDPIFLAQYDLNGNEIYATSLSSGGDDQNGVAADTSGNAYLASDFQSNPFIIGANTLALTGVENVFLAKYHGLADRIYENNYRTPFQFFPNPNNGFFNIQIDAEIENGKLILINSIGQKAYEQKIYQGTNQIISNGLPTGIYNCILCQENQQISSGRIIIE